MDPQFYTAMDRRKILGIVSGSALSSSLPVMAQQEARPRRIGYLAPTTAETSAPFRLEFEDALRALGYVEGRDVMLERRYANGSLDLSPALANELVRLPVDVLVASENSSIVAAKRATVTIPIVMINAVDPVQVGLVASLSRPGGNITGLSQDASKERNTKLLELLKEMVPSISAVALLRSSEFGPISSAPTRESTQSAARKLNLRLEVVEVRRAEDMEAAFDTMTKKRVDAFIDGTAAMTSSIRQQFANLAINHRLIGITPTAELVRLGLLAAYGARYQDIFRRAAFYVDRILKGAKPADLPVEQPTRFRYLINARTARTLGLALSQNALVRADEIVN
jgi:putative ABC transport system substrate-binding protein